MPKPDAIALIKADHRKVEELFEKFEKARDEDRKRALAREICTELTIHAMIEEEILYPASRARSRRGMLDEAYVEHDGAKVLISEIWRLDAEFFEAKVTVLCERSSTTSRKRRSRRRHVRAGQGDGST